MSHSIFAAIILGLVIAADSSMAQPYGLNQSQPISAYLNEIFPHTAPSSSASWNTEVAFTNIIFSQPIFMLPYPGTNRLVMLHKPGTITTFPNRRNALQSEEVPFLDISARTFTVSDSGLTGLVFHPEFGQAGSTNRGFFYITYKHRPTGLTGNADFAYIRLSRFMVPDGTTLTNTEYLASMPSGSVYGGVSSCGLDGNGEIYFLKFGGDGSGQVFKLARTTTVVPEPPALLSQVGAFTNLATLAPAPGLIPYKPNAQLWSDNANKYRWLAVPSDGTNDSPGEKITFSATNEWTFPAGTVFVKHFELPVNETNPAAVRRLETRFVVRDQSGGVYGVTYKWRTNGLGADLLTTGDAADYDIITTSNTLRTQHWSFPSRLDCLNCHNAGWLFPAENYPIELGLKSGLCRG